MDRLKEPTAEAALKWLKTRGCGSQMPGARRMMTKAAEELEYRVPKNPDSRYEKSRHETVPICPTCNTELEHTEYCSVCGQAIDWGDEA